jgi:hypothetical protein
VKLKTEISGNDDDVILVCNGDIDVSADDQMEHDAAAAHALMRALDDTVCSRSTGAFADALYAKADELMRKWGFEQDKVTP